MTQFSRDITEIFRNGARYRTARMESVGISGRQANIISEICANPGISQDQLAQRIFINKSNAARQVATLEEDGYITRTSCTKDKRIVRLHPTEKALALLPRIDAMQRAWEQHLAAELTEEERSTLAALLARVKVRAADWTEVE